jgi:hypothetical protein
VWTIRRSEGTHNQENVEVIVARGRALSRSWARWRSFLVAEGLRLQNPRRTSGRARIVANAVPSDLRGPRSRDNPTTQDKTGE